MDRETRTTVEASTYFISSEFADGALKQGTGFCIGVPGIIMTCSHTVSRKVGETVEVATSIIVATTLATRTDQQYARLIKNGDPKGPVLHDLIVDVDKLDLALLQVDDRRLPLYFKADDPAVASACHAFGADETEEEDDDEVLYRIASGQVTGVFANPQGVTSLVRCDCADVSPGFSGGPLTDDEGDVIGVVVLAHADGGRTDRYAYSATIAWRFVPDLHRHVPEDGGGRTS